MIAREAELRSFLTRVDQTGDCWLWKASCSTDGYGGAWLDGRLQCAHRVAYELMVGPIPEGLEIDHLCNVRGCVNPAHLEPVTHAENMRRSAARRTHCPQGHPYDEANTYQHPSKGRVCRACQRAHERTRRRTRAA